LKNSGKKPAFQCVAAKENSRVLRPAKWPTDLSKENTCAPFVMAGT
jgi:hypothetical protein